MLKQRQSTLFSSISFLLILCLLIPALLPAPAAAAAETKQAEQLNTVYPLEEDHVVLDKINQEGYVDNIIVIFVRPGTEDSEILSWFPGEAAEIAGRFPKLRQVQVRIRPRTRAELDTLAVELMKKDEVVFAHLDLAASTVWEENSAPSPSAAARQMPFAQSETAAPTAELTASATKETTEADGGETPADPLATDRKPDAEWWYGVVGLEEARKQMPEGNLVKVGVVDDGFDTNHKDLHLVFIGDEHKKQNLPESHGTHVAGIVQQVMLGAPITVIDSYRIPGVDPDGRIATQCRFMKHVVDMVEADVKVVNFSMGADMTDDSLLPWAVDFAGIASVYIWLLKQAGRDFILVQSAGNVGIDTYRNGVFCTLNEENCLGSADVRKSLGVADRIEAAQKAVFDSIVIVGASGRKLPSGKYPLLEMTNYGDKVTLLAPGAEINSTVPGGYLVMTGTSQAAPIVSGALGLLWSMNNKLSSGELKQLLIDSATEMAVDPESKNEKGRREHYPLLNIGAAVEAVRKKP